MSSSDTGRVPSRGWVACPYCDCCSLGTSNQDDAEKVCDLCRVSSPYGAGLDGCPCDPHNAPAKVVADSVERLDEGKQA